MRLLLRAIVVVAVMASSLAITLPVTAPTADAQQSCSVISEAQLRACLADYTAAASGSVVTIELNANVGFDSRLTIENEATPTPAILIFNGNGRTLSGPSPDTGPDIYQHAGDVQINNLTLTNANGMHLRQGSTVITGSTVHNNHLGVYSGGDSDEPGISITLVDSTVTNNQFFGVWVGINPSDSLTITRSTITDNGATGVQTSDPGVPISIEGSLIVGNDVNFALGQCAGLVGVTESGNAIADETCTGTATPGLEGTYSPTVASNGCLAPCTQTIALFADSPAVDANSVCSAGLSDQRGVARTGGKCDAGAFELGDRSTCQGLVATVDMILNGGNGDGTDGPDVIVGTAGDDAISGFGGDDIICAGPGADSISGGDGLDNINGGPDDDIIDGGDQADTINGGGGNDIINGGNGWDRLTGSIGNDTIVGGNGNDWVWAGPGIDSLFGGSGNDLLLGFDGDDTIVAGDGNDLMNGMNGDDDVEGGNGFDQIWGGFGNDHLKGQGGFDWIWGRGGSDLIEGGYGNDRLFGEDSDDTIDGGPGNDLIDGGNGNDDCDGAAGTDTAANCESAANIP